MSKPSHEEALSTPVPTPPAPTGLDWRTIFAGAVISAAAGALVKHLLKHPDLQGKGSPRDGGSGGA